MTVCFANNECDNTTAGLFNKNHPNKDGGLQYVEHLIDKFRTTGSVDNMKQE